MNRKPIDERLQAKADISAAIDYYLRQGSEASALGFLDALQSLYHEIDHLAAGSLRYGEILKIEGLRTRSLGRYPFIVLYIERERHVDVWRILHGRRDIPPLMREP